MSGFITATPGAYSNLYGQDTNRLYGSPFVDIPRPEFITIRAIECDHYQVDWPLGGLLGGFSPMGLSGIVASNSYDEFLQAADWTGHMGWKTISGVTRDTNSAVLPSCQVLLFRTADKLLMDEKTSDPNTGAYSVLTSDTGNHFVVTYKAGAPDVSGVSVNTLTGV